MTKRVIKAQRRTAEATKIVKRAEEFNALAGPALKLIGFPRPPMEKTK